MELRSLIGVLELSDSVNWDWLILLLAKTGLRFSEALALTPQDFDPSSTKIQVSKTWDYKNPTGGFAATKNPSSVRTITIDNALNQQFQALTRHLAQAAPVFVQGRVFNSTVNARLSALCAAAGVPVISLHTLRHTHASLLLYAGVSVASIAKRLGHASVSTTQQTYLHIIRELEDRDNRKILQVLESI
jgi:integrase